MAVEEGVADNSGAGEARVKVESDLVPGSQSKLISNLGQGEKRDGELGTMLLALVSQESWEQSIPYMPELELVSPWTTMLHPGQIPSGCRASNCRQGGGHSKVTELHCPTQP